MNFFLRNNRIFSRLLIALVLVCFLTTGVLPNLAHAQIPNISGPSFSKSTDKAELSSYKVPPSDAASTFQKGTLTYFLTKNSDGTYSIFYKDQNSDSDFFYRVNNRVLSQSEFATSVATDRPISALDSKLPVVGHVVGAILFLIQWFLGKLIYTAGMLLDGVLGITTFSKVPAVQHGWTVVRDLCNMLFALILLIIAFATILHLESYGMKQLLWKLVVAAILINFSFTLAGMIIDFSQVLTNFFVNASKGTTNSQQISATLILNGLNFNNLFGFNQGVWTALSNLEITSWGGPTIGILVDMLLIIILLAVALFAVLALAILFLIRIIALWVILIFAPLAWLCMVLPATKHIWDKWWSALLQWSFFAPAATFLLYLAIVIIQQGDIAKMQTSTPLAAVGQARYYSSFLNNPQSILQYIMVVGLLVASVLVARSMGIMGASAVISMGKGAKNLALGAIGGAAAGTGAWAGRRAMVATGGAVGEEGARWAATADRWRQAKGWRAVVARPAAWVTGQASRLPTMYAERARQEVAKQEKTYGSWSTASRLKEIPLAAPAARAALMKLEAENLTEDMKKYLPEVRRIGGDTDSILVHKPHWAEELMPSATVAEKEKAMDHWVSEATRTGVRSKWKADTVGNIKVLDSWRRTMPSTSAFASDINRFTGEVRNTILATLQKNFSVAGVDDFTDKASLSRRKSYARATGDIQIAYQDNSKQIAQTGAQADVIKDYIKTLNSRQLGDVEKNRPNAALLARHMTGTQAGNDMGEIKAYMKTMVAEEAKAHNPDLHKIINRLPFWNINVKQPAGGRKPKPPSP